MVLKKMQLAGIMFLLSFFSGGAGIYIYLSSKDTVHLVLGMSASTMASIVYLTQGIRVIALNKEELSSNTQRKPEDRR